MKKEINVTQVSDEETNKNLEIEEEIEFNNWKEQVIGYSKVIGIIIGVCVIIYILIGFSVQPTTLEDIRVENFKKANSFVEINKQNLLKSEKMVEIYKKRIEDGNWCILNNQEKGKAVDCRIFNNK